MQREECEHCNPVALQLQFLTAASVAFRGRALELVPEIIVAQSPVWNPRGRELFYQGRTDVMAVAISDGKPVQQPVKLFGHPTPTGMQRDWTISADGQWFLVVDDAETRSGSQINVVLNFLEELKTRVP